MRSRVLARPQAALPRSLMQRLERMAQGQSWEAAGEGLDDDFDQFEQEGRPVVSFACGLLAGMVVAGAALLGVTMFELQESGARNPRLPIAKATATAPAPAVLAAPAAKDMQPVTFDVAIDRRDRAHARLGLRLSGADAADLEVILSNVPPAAQLSRGERRGDSTWAVKAADLGDLFLALHDGAPEAFDVRIDVAAPPGMAAAPSIAKVRLVGSVPAVKSAAVEEQLAQPPATKAVATAAPPPPPAPAPIQKAGASSVEKIARPRRRTQAAVADKAAPEPQDKVQVAPQPRPWTEAPSALGATSPGEWERQVWWQLPLSSTPAPAWSPFLDPPTQR
jgi:hypothetical protein